LRSDVGVFRASLNELGEFDLRGLAPGHYLVTIALENIVISLPLLKLPA
jgi:hypothetical protein